MLPEITATVLQAKAAKGLTCAELAKVAGCNPVFLAAVGYRQASATREQAEKRVEALGLDVNLVPELTAFPVKGGLMPKVPVDPLLYRFHEVLQVYGLPLMDVIQETSPGSRGPGGRHRAAFRPSVARSRYQPSIGSWYRRAYSSMIGFCSSGVAISMRNEARRSPKTLIA
jgi:cyanate lyase